MKITRNQFLSLIQEAVDSDGDGALSSSELRQLADELEKDDSVDPVDELISYIQTVTAADEIGISEVEEMLRDQGHSAEKIDSVLEDPRLDQYYDALEDIFAPASIQEENIKGNTAKITRKQLRQLIRETLDPDLLKGAYVSSREDREAFKDYIAKVKEKRMSMGILDPADDHLESITSQDMADAKRYAKSDNPRDQADYLGIGVEDWHRIRQELDDHYEDRHMEDQMAFDDDPDLDNDGMLSVGELVKMTQNIADDVSESKVKITRRQLNNLIRESIDREKLVRYIAGELSNRAYDIGLLDDINDIDPDALDFTLPEVLVSGLGPDPSQEQWSGLAKDIAAGVHDRDLAEIAGPEEDEDPGDPAELRGIGSTPYSKTKSDYDENPAWFNEGKIKITKDKLRQMINEELSLLNEQSSPAELYDRLTYLRNEHQGEFELLDMLGDEKFNEVIQIRDEILVNPSLEGYAGYKEFFDRVKQQYRLFPQTVRNLYDERYGKIDIEALKRFKSEHDELARQFETRRASNTTDYMYGRKRTEVVHTPTGEVVHSRVDRKGSLGT